MVASWIPEGSEAPRRGHLHLVREDVTGLVAHDLKTPLAAIAMNLDFALGELGPEAPPGVRGALQDCREASQRAVRLVTDMVDATRFASGELRPHLRPFDAQDVVAAVVRRIAPDAAMRSVRLMWTAESVAVHAEPDLLDRVLDRLLDHALRYARGGGAIDVTLRPETIVLRVRTPEGRGAPPEPVVAMRALATHFADAAMRAQGGAVWTEGDVDGALLFVVALPA